MDKWKDVELEKMKIGGNRNAQEFFDTQDDWDDTMSIQQKYNTKAAALYRNKISCLAQGKTWDASSSSAKNYTSSHIGMSHSKSSGAISQGNGSSSYQNGGNFQQDSGGYQQFNTPEFRDQKEQYFNKKQQENAMRPE